MAEEGEGGRWNHHGAGWLRREAKKDEFMSSLTRMVSILPERKHLFGGPCHTIEITKVGVRPTAGKGSEQDPECPDAWEKEAAVV